jgi:hypothetical protein
MSLATVWGGGTTGTRVAGVPLSYVAYRVLALSFALLFGALLSQMPNEQFKDFVNYLDYAEYSWNKFLLYQSFGIISAFSNEPAWLLLNSALGIFFPPEPVVRTYIFFSASMVAWLVLSNNPRHFLLLILFLLLPMVVKNWLIHLRQGVAIAFFLWGWYAPGPARRWLGMGLAPFVHASFFFVLIVLFFTKTMRNLRLGHELQAIAFVMFCFCLGVGLRWIVAMLGARQAEEYTFAAQQISGLGFCFWCVIVILWILEGRKFLRMHSFEFGMILFYLSTYW